MKKLKEEKWMCWGCGREGKKGDGVTYIYFGPRKYLCLKCVFDCVAAAFDSLGRGVRNGDVVKP